MATRLQIDVDDSVLLRVTHANLKTFSASVRFSLQSTVESVKEKLWRKCGTSVNSMSLELYDDTNSKISDLTDNSRPLGFYSPLDGFRLHVIDLDPSSVTSVDGWKTLHWWRNTQFQKRTTTNAVVSFEEQHVLLDGSGYILFMFLIWYHYVITGTFRKFKEKLVSQNPSAFEPKITDNYMEDLCAHIKVGDRCEVEPGEKRGVVKFVGRAESLAPGFWVGVQYDEPLGKHDGMVKGVRYFDCPPLHGAMVRSDKVKVCGKLCSYMLKLLHC
ncbi:hypothetical protein GH714_036766 [Hevea brasiliensis]|uniref:CAP-Gly domain-containing protein n=1 Tax=Hevea brasiliensis TaxID=3981 RepID=A0A6A6M4H1_HEVBR|nr:hypothetical protein GH714_036766 [Hevea brasiliensis]